LSVDFKKVQRELYQPGVEPVVVDVPEMTFIAVDGVGDPNVSADYMAAIEVLYGLSYAIKMSNKHILEYVVPPLEGFWSVDDATFRGGGEAIRDKSKFEWTMVIRQPDFVCDEVFAAARDLLAKKKRQLDTSQARLITLTEGLCVQVMHIGPYDSEPATIARMDSCAIAEGYTTCISNKRCHHEIYLSDPRRVAPEKLRTVIRHPIKRT